MYSVWLPFQPFVPVFNSPSYPFARDVFKISHILKNVSYAAPFSTLLSSSSSLDINFLFSYPYPQDVFQISYILIKVQCVASFSTLLSSLSLNINFPSYPFPQDVSSIILKKITVWLHFLPFFPLGLSVIIFFLIRSRKMFFEISYSHTSTVCGFIFYPPLFFISQY